MSLIYSLPSVIQTHFFKERVEIYCVLKALLPVPVRLNWRVHMHFPEAVHLGQSEASQLVSVQLLDRKISLWLIRQSCSDVQLTELLIQAPSGQFVHHLHCREG